MEKRTGIRQITFQEWTVVMLALIPHVCPQILGIFFVQNKNLDCQETEFGGWKGPVVSWLSAYQRNLLVHHHWGRRGKEESVHPYVRERPLVLFSQYSASERYRCSPVLIEEFRAELRRKMLPAQWLGGNVDELIAIAAETELSGGSIANVVRGCTIALVKEMECGYFKKSTEQKEK